MRRFATNRWLAFLLTLSFLLASSASLTSPSYGDGTDPIVNPDPSGGSGTAPGGDPDGPSGPGKKLPNPGSALTGGAGFQSLTPVGDGGPAWRVWSWRFHVVLLSLRIRFLRF